MTPPVTEMAFVVGPIEPATKRGLLEVENSAAACRASRAAVSFIDELVLKPVLGEDDRGAAEGVGFDDVGAGFEIAAMHVEHDIGTGEDEVFVAAFELRAAEIFGGEVARLKRRARRAVEHEYALGQQFFK